MMNALLKAFTVVAAALIAGCASAVNGVNQAVSVEEAHPISVDSQVVTLTINASQSSPSSLDQARVRAFSDAYLRNGHGPVTVTTPSGRQNFASSVRDLMNAVGVPTGSMAMAEYRPSGEQNPQIILSYTHYVAQASACGIWSGIKEADRRNLRTPNFGCATQNNLAAMVADPRDLIQPADTGPADTAARIRAIRSFREGEVSSVQTDGDIEVSVSE